MGISVFMRLCGVRTARRRHGRPAIILILNAEAAETRNRLDALLPRIKVA
jgi:hypothetical protein